MASTEKRAAKGLILSKGAWTPEEDSKLAEVIAVHGAKRWKTIASKAGLQRCGKSCRLRWMNYLRPNIKRGNITNQEEDLILRLHKLLGNRWSLIAGRLPGRTDNEIKNYWNSHLSKRIRQKGESQGVDPTRGCGRPRGRKSAAATGAEPGEMISSDAFDMDEFFDFSNESPMNLEWVSSFLQHYNRGQDTEE
ncbi:hypothetical protein MLD38_007871 [Melastoma candidum]|uniref:Uncharacterized protein n=1 Tax=Melastoma candidum TaxID=119954 RepID=A0ACB9RS65_9MYRT|nr:hypothetical protein MLD38_007871 [Melastoma candidum]